jgi:hypothetical protein
VQSGGNLNLVQKVKLFLIFQKVDLQNFIIFGCQEDLRFEFQSLC